MDAFLGLFLLIPSIGFTVLFSAMARDVGDMGKEPTGIGGFYRNLIFNRPAKKTFKQLKTFIQAVEVGKFDDVSFDYKTLGAIVKAHELTDYYFEVREYTYLRTSHSISYSLTSALITERKHRTEPSADFTNELLGFLITYHKWRNMEELMTTETAKAAWEIELPILRDAAASINGRSLKAHAAALDAAKDNYRTIRHVTYANKSITGGY